MDAWHALGHTDNSGEKVELKLHVPRVKLREKWQKRKEMETSWKWNLQTEAKTKEKKNKCHFIVHFVGFVFALNFHAFSTFGTLLYLTPYVSHFDERN